MFAFLAQKENFVLSWLILVQVLVCWHSVKKSILQIENMILQISLPHKYTWNLWKKWNEGGLFQMYSVIEGGPWNRNNIFWTVFPIFNVNASIPY